MDGDMYGQIAFAERFDWIKPLLLAFFFWLPSSMACQTLDRCQGLLQQMAEFEGQRDPKCAATANRLEDFMFGTPLTPPAREAKVDVQKSLIRNVWKSADQQARSMGASEVTEAQVLSALNEIIRINREQGRVSVETNGERLYVTTRDIDHYGSVAYAYRALLAVQQDMLFSEQAEFLPLTNAAAESIKNSIDVITLAALKKADNAARDSSNRVIDDQTFLEAWSGMVDRKEVVKDEVASSPKSASIQRELFLSMVRQKQASFYAYNEISLLLFQRNAQVYFSRYGWPKEAQANESFRALYNEAILQFINGLWLLAQSHAESDGAALIRGVHMRNALDAVLPFEQNEWEDIRFFPLLDKEQQVTIESYDLDAFRDGGVHWTYLSMALEDANFEPRLYLDPFALEWLSEGIAHMGVLSLRLAGILAKERGDFNIDRTTLIQSLQELNDRKDLHAYRSAEKVIAQEGARTTSARWEEDPGASNWFVDKTALAGINFMHKSSDWLSRFIRSYSVDENEGVVRTAIPPAFGGSGVATEDWNNDGWADILLVGGRGNALYINNQDGTFRNATAASGIGWKRDDGTYGEPRQVIAADFDNDGWQDLFISYVNDEHRMYRNQGGGIFDDVTEKSNLGGKGQVGGPCTALDYDRDGLLDLYIGYFGNYLKGSKPTLARSNANGDANVLFRNKGDFQFEKSSFSGAEDSGWTQAVGHTDIDLDGWQDLISGNDFGSNAYYINNQDGSFREVSGALNTDKPSYTMNIGIADLNRDRRPDFYISNIVVMEKDEKYVNPSAATPMELDPAVMANMRVVEANDLFMSMPEGTEGYSLSQQVSRGYSSTGWSWDADFFDFDNDGDDDLYCLTGMNDFFVYSQENPYFEDADGGRRSVSFANSSREPNVLFENRGGALQAMGKGNGLDVIYNSRSAAFLDYDNDGAMDVIVNNYHDQAMLFRNDKAPSDRRWIKLRLVGDPALGITRDAIGAVVVIESEEQEVWREVHATTGYLSSHTKTLHSGVGYAERVNVSVHWPNGEVERFLDLNTNSMYRLSIGEDPVGINERRLN